MVPVVPTVADVPALIELFAKAHAESPFRHIPYDHRAMQTITAWVAAPNVLVRVLRDGDRIVGGIVGVIGQHWFACGDVATDAVTYVEHGYRGHGIKLQNALRRWAKGFKSVQYIIWNVSIGGDQARRTERLYEKRGFERIGAQFIERCN